uniref:Secreted protein n=1 Tax=Rhipicephalus appendiculatus TaxID=34631 RepID=A0A131YB91_RHIAP
MVYVSVLFHFLLSLAIHRHKFRKSGTPVTSLAIFAAHEVFVNAVAPHEKKNHAVRETFVHGPREKKTARKQKTQPPPPFLEALCNSRGLAMAPGSIHQ